MKRNEQKSILIVVIVVIVVTVSNRGVCCFTWAPWRQTRTPSSKQKEEIQRRTVLQSGAKCFCSLKQTPLKEFGRCRTWIPFQVQVELTRGKAKRGTVRKGKAFRAKGGCLAPGERRPYSEEGYFSEIWQNRKFVFRHSTETSAFMFLKICFRSVSRGAAPASSERGADTPEGGRPRLADSRFSARESGKPKPQGCSRL